MTAAWRIEGPWRDLADGQHGVVSRQQLLGLGWSDADVHAARRAAGWRCLGRGVFVTHRGPLPPAGRRWAAVLRCGGEAALASWSALHAWGLDPDPHHRDGLIHVAVPAERRLTLPPGLCLHRSRHYGDRVHPVAVPPRQRVEAALLDATAEAVGPAQAAALVLTVVSARVTTAQRVADELGRRPCHPGRADLIKVLDDAVLGVASRLEAEYLSAVHRRHGLPPARFNAADRLEGDRIYRDVEYEGGLVVELDGAAHRDVRAAAADRRRDNDLVVRGGRTLRWPEVFGGPCASAATVLDGLGMPGRGRPCWPGCAVGAQLVA